VHPPGARTYCKAPDTQRGLPTLLRRDRRPFNGQAHKAPHRRTRLGVPDAGLMLVPVRRMRDSRVVAEVHRLRSQRLDQAERLPPGHRVLSLAYHLLDR
jgi:hypothetical protein